MNRRRIILSSIVGCMSLAIISITASLAWYANSDLLSVDTLEVTISDDMDLKISTSNELDTFVDELNKEDLGINEDFFFSPASSVYKSSWYDEKQDTPIFYDCSFYTANSSGEPDFIEKEEGFLRKKLYLKAGRDCVVGLDTAGLIFESDSEANIARAQEELNKNPSLNLTANQIKEQLDKLINCLRISILVTDPENYQYLIIDPFKEDDEAVQFGGRLDNDADGYYDYFTTREGLYKEIVFGEVNDRSFIEYDEPTNLNVKASEIGNSFIANSKGTVYAFNAEKSTENGLQYALEESTSLDELEVEEPSFQIPCYADQPREIVISIYLEGWDLDCVNTTMGASFNTKLSFKLLRGNL